MKMENRRNVRVPPHAWARMHQYSRANNRLPLTRIVAAAIDLYCSEIRTSAKGATTSEATCAATAAGSGAGIASLTAEFPGLIDAHIISAHLFRWPAVTLEDYRGYISATQKAIAAGKGPRDLEAYLFWCCKKRTGSSAASKFPHAESNPKPAKPARGMTSEDVYILEMGTPEEQAEVKARLNL